MTNQFTPMHVVTGRPKRQPHSFLLGLLFLISFVAQAQIQVVPIYGAGQPVAPSAARTVPTPPQPQQEQARSLPFFDDFSLSTTTPDPNNWMPGGGADISNTIAINHPSVNVVTFNGLKANGIPYDVVSELARGSTDTLTSVPINLKDAGSNIRLIFFWQARGLGELPDAEDSLVLQFKDVNNGWRTILPLKGQVVNDNFTQVNLALTSRDFHENFQFRFIAYGKRSGAFDVWNLDYVYLNSGITALTNFFIKDVACERNINAFLRRYTAMPLKQYLLDPAKEHADAVRIEITNLFENNNPATFSYQMSDVLTKTVYQTTGGDATIGITQDPNRLTRQVVSANVQLDKPLPDVERLILKQKFTIITGENANESIPTVNLALNDTLSNYTVLDNYYAYDDGTAEYGAGINQRLGKIAIRYIVNQPDGVKAVNLYIARIRKDLQGQSFVLQIYDNANGRPDKILYQASTPVTYSASQNEFIPVPLGFYRYDPTTDKNVFVEMSVAVKDTFYVGWQQTTQDLLPIGLDKNTHFSNNIFYNLGTKTSDWQADTTIKGGFMIRPVMGQPTIVTGIDEEPITATAFTLSPNPTTGVIAWNDARFTSAKVYDLGGRLLFSQTLKPQSTPQADLGFLQNGLYLLHLSDGKRTLVRKVVIAK